MKYPSTQALNNVTSEVESVIPPIPNPILLINIQFKNTFKTIDEKATVKGVAESLKE